MQLFFNEFPTHHAIDSCIKNERRQLRFSLSKNTAMWKKANPLFQAEFFNFFNHPVFNNAGAALQPGGGYDQLPSQNAAAGNQRLVQMSLRPHF